jgi:hypothetical protein
MIDQRGTTLIMTVILLLLLSLFGLMIFHVSESEVQMAAAQKEELQAFYLAEAGIQLVNYWFHHPNNFQDEGNFFQDYPAGEPRKFFLKRLTGANGAWNFLDGSGRSQFSGTQERPDLAYDATQAEDDRFLNGPDHGLLQQFHERGRLARLKLYQPTLPGSVCTVEATGITASGAKRTVAAEFLAVPVPTLTSAVQIDDSMGQPLPLLVHWGDIKTLGKGDLGESLTAIPVKDAIAFPDGNPYQATQRIDHWVDFYIGDETLNPLPKDCGDCSEPYLSTGQGNIHQRQPLSLDHWDYLIYKAAAHAYGTYYSTDETGLLYLDGIRDTEHRRSAQQAFTGRDSQQFIFIDTTDGNPPSSDNLATLTVEAGDLSGIVYLNANLKLLQNGSGRTVQVFPPPPFSETSVALNDIHFRGAIYSPGSLYVEGHPMLFGAISFRKGIAGPGQLEIWYDDRLRSGYLPGHPVVSMAAGSWRELEE